MLPRFLAPDVPTTSKYWHELEDLLADCAARGVKRVDVPPTPMYEGALDRQLADRTPAVARRERFPAIAIAAAAASVIALAGFLAWMPADNGPTTAATPGVGTTTTVTVSVSAEQMVVASFQRWVEGRTEEERLTNRLTNAGYDVVVQRLNVAEPERNGRVLEVRHGVGTTGTTIGQPRGQVILVIGRTIAAGANISG